MTDTPRSAADAGDDQDRELDDLDDVEDRQVLRERYYGLLQELRVVLPGVQVLLAFLLTAPFSSRFEELDRMGEWLFAVALLASATAVVCLLTPTVLHRAGERQARRERLRWSIRLTVTGLISLAIAIVAAIACVTRFVFDAAPAAAMSTFVAGLLLVLWVALPRVIVRTDDAGRTGASPVRSR